MVSLGTGWKKDNRIVGGVTRYADFTVGTNDSLVAGAVDNPPAQVNNPPALNPPAPIDQGDCTDRAELVGKTVEDGTTYPPGTGFSETWGIKNTGTCTWTTAYSLNFNAGVEMESSSPVHLSGNVEPGKNTVIAVFMKSPAAPGSYQGTWIMKNASGQQFDAGANSTSALTVSIKVDLNAIQAAAPGTDPAAKFDIPGVGGGPGSSPNDIDKDGLTDFLEDVLANAFRPYFEYASGEFESKNTILRFYQVTPIYPPIYQIDEPEAYKNYRYPEYNGPGGILLTYVLTYRNDEGDPYFGLYDHAGDAEMIRIFIVNPPGQPSVWYPAVVVIKRHFDDPQFYKPGKSQTWQEGTHLKVYVSEDKHAMYISKDECEDYTHSGYDYVENCGGGYSLNEEIEPGVDGFNVGERREHPFSRIPENPRHLYTREFVWSSRESWYDIYDQRGMTVIYQADKAEKFCGGLLIPTILYSPLSDDDCGGGMDGKWFPMNDPGSQGLLVNKLGWSATDYYQQKFGAAYEVCVTTGKVPYADTSLNVNLTLRGSLNSLALNWINYGEGIPGYTNGPDYFGKGATDCFQLGTYSLDEELNRVKVSVWGANLPSDTEWFLESFTVTRKFNNQKWTFVCNCWLDTSAHYDAEIKQNTFGPTKDLTPLTAPQPPAPQPQPVASGWTKTWGPTGALYAGGNALFATKRDTGDMYRYNGSPMDWTKIGGPAREFDANDNGELFAIASDGKSIWQWAGTPNKWNQVGGPARHIYAGGNELFATNPDSGNIYRYNHKANDWTKIGGPGRVFAVDNLGNLFGISPDGVRVLVWTGKADTWEQIGDKAMNLFAGGVQQLFAIDPIKGDIYHYDNAPYQWTRIGSSELTFAVNASGQLFSLTQDGKSIWLWKGMATPNEWKRYGDAAAMIFSGGTNGLCALNPDSYDLWCYK